MIDHAPDNFKYPSTRYSGSKRRLLPWIWQHIKKLKFDSVLDVFGGTASVSLMFKRFGKEVYYNDILKSNQIIGRAIIENANVKVTEKDINSILDFSKRNYPNFIQSEFRRIFFRDKENEWLEKVIVNILRKRNEYKKAILLASLFQACLAKRPFNLFHRANLNIRTRRVNRSFGNKTTWERPFDELLKRYICEYNNAVFSNGKNNKVIGGYDALCAPNGVDLVYLDPPYFHIHSCHGTNYLTFYHFLEGLANYKAWPSKIRNSKRKAKIVYDLKEINHFTNKEKLIDSFTNLLRRFENNIIILSYRTQGIPSKSEMRSILRRLGKNVRIYEKPYKYALSKRRTKELLFVAT